MPKTNIFATDKDIYDLLKSSAGRITNSDLCSFLLKRGIIVSKEEDRETLIDYISELNHYYNDINDYLDEIHIEKSNTFKKKSSQIKGVVESDIIQKSLDGLQRQIQDSGEVLTTTNNGDGIITVKVDYTEYNFGVTSLKQKVDKYVELELIIKDSELKIRRPNTDKSDAIYNELKKIIKLNAKDDIEEEEINLTPLTTPLLVNTFFTNILKSIPGFTLTDVTKIRVHRLVDDFGNQEKGTVEIDDEETEDIDDEETEDIETGSELDDIGYLKGALLDGTSLLQSKQFRSLCEDNYAMCLIRWVAENELKTEKVEFEVSLKDSNDPNSFQFNVNGHFTVKENDGSYTLKKPVKDKSHKDSLLTLLEQTSLKTLNLLLVEEGLRL